MPRWPIENTDQGRATNNANTPNRAKNDMFHIQVAIMKDTLSKLYDPKTNIKSPRASVTARVNYAVIQAVWRTIAGPDQIHYIFVPRLDTCESKAIYNLKADAMRSLGCHIWATAIWFMITRPRRWLLDQWCSAWRASLGN